jgi:hypothetical protein
MRKFENEKCLLHFKLRFVILTPLMVQIYEELKAKT